MWRPSHRALRCVSGGTTGKNTVTGGNDENERMTQKRRTRGAERQATYLDRQRAKVAELCKNAAQFELQFGMSLAEVLRHPSPSDAAVALVTTGSSHPTAFRKRRIEGKRHRTAPPAS